MRETFPKLKDYFRKKGLEFQVVDMRWGVREESVLDHMATRLCTQEIFNTQKISRGVSFLVKQTKIYTSGNERIRGFN